MGDVPIGELVRPAGRRAGPDTELPVYSVTKHAGFVPSLEYFRKQVFSRDLKGYKVVEAGDFAYATIHLDEGSIGIAPQRALISPMYTVFTIDDTRVDHSYVLRFLKSPRALAQYPLLGKGAIHRRMSISLAALGSLTVPLPPLAEQRRIAAILDHADALRAKRRQVLAHLDALTQSTFYALFGEDSWRSVTAHQRQPNSRGWEWIPLSAVTEMATGHTPDRRRSDYWNGSIPWISLPDIRQLDGRTALDTELHVSEAGIANSSAVLLPPNTVCFSRTASIGFVTKMGRPMSTSQDFHNWVPGPLVNADYLMAALRASRAHLLGSSDGSTHKTIYQRVAERFRVLLPPIELQEGFAARSRHVNAQVATARRALVADDELFASLQSRAFRGEL